MIESKLVRLSEGQALPELKQKLNGYRRYWNRIYIGLTANPQVRWEKHVPNGWTKMVVLYEAFTAEIGRRLERNLIDYAHQCNFQISVENINPGGEGILDQNGIHYLYVLAG